MKQSKIIGTLVLGLVLSLSFSLSQGARAQLSGLQETVGLVNLLPDQVFTPKGFDDNDNAQLVITGQYMNSCFKVGPNKVLIDKEKKEITIENQAYVYESSWCIWVLVPYEKTIEFGPLPDGHYEIKFKGQNDGQIQKMGVLNVSRGQGPAPDDFLYAPVKEAIVKVDRATKHGVLTIEGEFTNNCLSLKEVKVMQTDASIIEVLPIVEVKKNIPADRCKDGNFPFEKVVHLMGNFKGKVLIHIRVLNGQAINKIADF